MLVDKSTWSLKILLNIIHAITSKRFDKNRKVDYIWTFRNAAELRVSLYMNVFERSAEITGKSNNDFYYLITTTYTPAKYKNVYQKNWG